MANRENKPYPKHERVRSTHRKAGLARALKWMITGSGSVIFVVMHPCSMNALLKTLFDSDRTDHSSPLTAGTLCHTAWRLRDAERRNQVRSIICDQNPMDSEDLYHAAWILNHGDQPADAEFASRLAVELDRNGTT